jgi:hypothetical protein
MSYPPEDDSGPQFPMDVPPSQPIGSIPVAFEVPIPTIEQVAGEMARQIINAEGWHGISPMRKQISAKIDQMIEDLVNAAARPMIEELLARPFTPTDQYGSPTGPAKTLLTVLGESVAAWGTELVDSSGKVGKPDHYNRDRYHSRIEWALRQVVSRDLTNAVDTEVKRVVADLKGQATTAIAKQIAERVAGMVLK